MAAATASKMRASRRRRGYLHLHLDADAVVNADGSIRQRRPDARESTTDARTGVGETTP